MALIVCYTNGNAANKLHRASRVAGITEISMKNGHDILPSGIMAKAIAAAESAAKKPETPLMALAREIREADAACMAAPTEENLDRLSALRKIASDIDAEENRREFQARKGQGNQKRSRQGYKKDDPLLLAIFG